MLCCNCFQMQGFTFLLLETRSFIEGTEEPRYLPLESRKHPPARPELQWDSPEWTWAQMLKALACKTRWSQSIFAYEHPSAQSKIEAHYTELWSQLTSKCRFSQHTDFWRKPHVLLCPPSAFICNLAKGSDNPVTAPLLASVASFASCIFTNLLLQIDLKGKCIWFN